MNTPKVAPAPRIALAPDGKIILFDESGEQIPPKEISREELITAVNEKELQHFQTISLFFVKNPECRVYIDLGPWGVYCYRVDCITGQYLGPC